MPIQCRLVTPDRTVPGWRMDLNPGDMWYGDPIWKPVDGSPKKSWLSVDYFRDHAEKRPPIWVMLPGRGGAFCVDSKPSGSPDGHGWTVTGEAPNITVNPSINAVGDYHGWLQNGVLSDDVEGRTYPAVRA